MLRRFTAGTALMLFFVLGGAAARAQDAPAGQAGAQQAGQPAPPASDVARAQEDRIAELERTVKVLADELERTRTEIAVPEEPELISIYGLGPAASRIYGVARGLSIGGYGEGYYRHYAQDGGNDDRADFLRAVLYAGYKFTDRILFNSEYEFEHATTEGEGSVSVEFAALDFMLADWANVRAGLLLLPMGFLNEIHEPPYFFGVSRPEVERRIIPTTWRENGVGIFGWLGEWLDYRFYVVNGLDATGFDASGLREGRQDGSEALAEDLAFVGRVDWTPIPELLLGASVYYGNSGQDQNETVQPPRPMIPGMPVQPLPAAYGVQIPNVPTTIWDVHAQYRSHGVQLRALFAMAQVGENGMLTRALSPVAAGGGGTGDLSAGEAIAGEMIGTYGEVAYDVLPLLLPDTSMSLEPFFRFEYLDTQRDLPTGFKIDQSQVTNVYTTGFSFKPIPNVVVKMDWRRLDARTANVVDELNMGVGFAF